MPEVRLGPESIVVVVGRPALTKIGKWAAVVLAVVLARLAQHPGSAAQAPAWVIAATVGAIALAGYAWPSPALDASLTVEQPREGLRKSAVGVGVLLLPAVLAFAIWSRENYKAHLAFVNASSSWAAVLWLVGVAGAIVYFWRQRLPAAPGRPRIVPPVRLPECLAVLGMIGVAAWLRLWNLDEVPRGIWYDVAVFKTVSEHLSSQTFQPLNPLISGYICSLYSYLIAAVMKFAGASLYTVRLTSALLGIGAIAAAYLLGRKMGGIPYGLAVGALLTVNRWELDFSRYGMPQIAAPALLTCSFIVLALAMLRPQALWFALCGILLGVTFQAYFGAMLVGGFAFVIVCIRLISDRDFRRQAWPCAVLGPVGLVVGAAPFLTVLYLDPTSTLLHEHGVSLFTQYVTLHDRVVEFLENARAYLLMFTVQGDANGRQNLPGTPILDPYTGILFLVGLGICFRRLNNWFYQLLIFWLGAALLSGILSVAYDAPNSGRAVAGIAPVALIAAMPLTTVACRVWTLLRRIDLDNQAAEPSPRIWRTYTQKTLPLVAATIVILVPVGAAARDTYDKYFIRQASDIYAWVEMGGLQDVVGHKAAALQSEGVSVRVPYNLSGDPAFTEAAGGLSISGYDPTIPVPPRIPAGGLALIIPTTWMDLLTNGQIASIYTDGGIVSSTSPPMLSLIQRLYPNARISTMTAAGEPPIQVAQVVTIEANAVADLSGLGMDELYRAALAEQDAGNFSDDLTYLDAVVKRNPDYEDTQFARGWALWNLGRPREAIEAYQTYLKTHPTSVQGNMNMAYSLIEQGDCGAAIPLLHRTLVLDPTNAAALRDLIVCRAG